MSGTVAKKASAALAEPSDLEGWDSDDVAAAIGQVLKGFRAQRLTIGLLLWKFRSLNVDAVYSEMQSKVAQDCDVDVRTLQRWRVFAEKKWALPPPDRRSEVQRGVDRSKGNDIVSLPRPAPVPTGNDKVSFPSSEPKPEKVKPEVLPTRPKATQLSLFEEREGRALVPARPPASREEVVEAKRIAKAYLDWAAQFEPEPGATPPKRSNPYTSRPNHASARRAPAADSAKAEKCLHPVTRRIGGNCAACGAKVGAK